MILFSFDTLLIHIKDSIILSSFDTLLIHIKDPIILSSFDTLLIHIKDSMIWYTSYDLEEIGTRYDTNL